jgi:hypothetical protein
MGNLKLVEKKTNVAPFRKGVRGVIKFAEELLAQAKAGDITFLAAACVHSDGSTSTGYRGPQESPLITVLGVIEQLKLRYATEQSIFDRGVDPTPVA